MRARESGVAINDLLLTIAMAALASRVTKQLNERRGVYVGRIFVQNTELGCRRDVEAFERRDQ